MTLICLNYYCAIRHKCMSYRRQKQKHQLYYQDYPGDEHLCSQFKPIEKGADIRKLKDCDYFAQVGNISDADFD